VLRCSFLCLQVRELVAFLRKRDKRVIAHQASSCARFLVAVAGCDCELCDMLFLLASTSQARQLTAGAHAEPCTLLAAATVRCSQ